MKSVFLITVLIVFGSQAVAAAAEAEADSVVGDVPSGPTQEQIKEEIGIVGATELPGDKQWERKKSPKVATLSSMALPGLGQLYNGRKWKTVIFFGTFTSFVAVAWTERKQAQSRLAARDSYDPGTIEWKQEDLFYQFHRQNALDFVWWSGAIWLVNVLDAFVDAHLYDVRGVEPTLINGSEMRYYGLNVEF